MRFRIRNLFNIRNLFKHGKEEYFYKPVRVGNFWSDNYVKYKGNADTNKTLPVEEYLSKIKPYFKDIMNNPKKYDT